MAAQSSEFQESINAKGMEISVLTKGDRDDYLSLTDIAAYKSDNPKDVVKNWMRNRNTLEFLGVWEKLHNSDFKGVEFDSFRQEAGLNSFVMTPTKWISGTNAIGIKTKRGRYGGGTFAHVDIAFEFASWISPEFKLFIIKDYQRLKVDENSRLSLEWNEKRLFSKINYQLHTDAIRESLVPEDVGVSRRGFIYASEADMLNVVLFGQTAKEWRDANPEAAGNMRDVATLNQLVVLANLESMNAQLIKDGISREERAVYLNKMAIQQMKALEDSITLRRLGSPEAEEGE